MLTKFEGFFYALTYHFSDTRKMIHMKWRLPFPFFFCSLELIDELFDDTGNGSRFFLPNSQTVHQHEKRKESPHQMCRGKESQRIFQRN